MVDEVIEFKKEAYDLMKYKDEIAQFVSKKRIDLDVISKMKSNYDNLYKSIFFGATASDVERYPYVAETYKVYKSALIEANLSGYSALFDVTGRDAYSVLQAPKVKDVMVGQCKSMSLLEKLSSDSLDDWILKGESVSFIKLKKEIEEYRTKETLIDAETQTPLMKFNIKQISTYQDLDIQRIDPLDFFVDAYDYEKDPRGCVKIVRTWLDAKGLLSSESFPLLSNEDKKNIVTSVGRNGNGYMSSIWGGMPTLNDKNSTDTKKIEVLTFYGDYITSDLKVLTNIKAVVINNRIADLKYSDVNTHRLIYAGYKIDEDTHRSISPIAVGSPINTLINRAVDMFLKNLEDVSDPVALVQKGTMRFEEYRTGKKRKFIEYNDLAEPKFYAPPPANMSGLQLIDLILNQGKNVLGLNNYMAGNTSGSVRTARESSILFQKANARMRVETDVFSYKFLLQLFNAFYTYNREIAIVLGEPLNEIYNDLNLQVFISTNASKADREGELNRLMEMLNLPIAQMIFSNLQPQQVILAVRYLMAKADLTDADNLLELVDSQGNTNAPPPPMDNGGKGNSKPTNSASSTQANIQNGGIEN